VQLTVFPKAWFESVGIEEATLHGIGTSAWAWESGSSNEIFRYSAVKDHWRHTPEFEFLEYVEIPETATLVANYQTGQIDAFTIGTFGASPLSFDEIAVIREVEGGVIKAYDDMAQVFIDFHGMNYVRRPLGDQPWISQDPDTSSTAWKNAVKVRKAMNIAIDRELIIDNLLLGQGTVPTKWVPGPPAGQNNWGEYDPDKARTLLAEAGYPDGFKAPMSLVNVFDGNPNNAGQAVCPMWEKELNIVCEIENAGIADFRAMGWVEGRYNGLTPHPAGAVLDPMTYAVYNTHSRGVLNFPGEHPEQDALIEKHEYSFTQADRETGANAWQQWMYDNQVVMPLFNTPVFAAFGPNVNPWPIDGREAGFFYLSRYDLATHKN